MPDDVFTKLPKFSKINFVTTKVNVKHTLCIRVSDKLVLFCQSNSRLKNFLLLPSKMVESDQKI